LAAPFKIDFGTACFHAVIISGPFKSMIHISWPFKINYNKLELRENVYISAQYLGSCPEFLDLFHTQTLKSVVFSSENKQQVQIPSLVLAPDSDFDG
jgi:hypothetical protein